MATLPKTDIVARLRAQRIEIPSWGFAATGTRFGKFPQPWAATNLEEKLTDAGQAQKYMGILSAVALHIPWDLPTAGMKDWAGVQAFAKSQGVTIGAINPNVFQDADYQFGSFCHPDAKVRAKAVAHHKECIDIAKATGSKALSLWYADGTNYPGQDSFRERRQRMLAAFQEVYAALPDDMRLLMEYKFYEPAWYHTDLADWGAASLMCKKLGPKATVLVDTGHHALGTNIEWIVASLLDEGLLGGFHFNSRKYGDDDLTVGSINPHELFLIYNELVDAESEGNGTVAGRCAGQIAYMFDQCHAYKNTIEATIQSAVSVQEAYAKALLVDRAALKKARAACDVSGAEEVLKDAFNTDVRPLVKEVREAMGIDPEPLKAFRASGYSEKAIAARTKKHAAMGAGGGF